MSSPPSKYALPLSALLSVVLPLAGSLVLYRWAGEGKWHHEPIHSTMETTGGLIALSMTGLLLLHRRFPGHEPHFEWVATSLACMGLLDVAHACIEVSGAFFWSRALPTLLGGLLFALVWAPSRWAGSDFVQRLPLLVSGLTLPVCLGLVLFPNAWPTTFSDQGSYTLAAKLLNVVGGVGFLVAGTRFLVCYRARGKVEDLVFANHCLLFGMAGVLFMLTHMWGSVWWFFHFLRLLAYGVVLRYVAVLYRRLQAAQEQALAQEVMEQSHLVQTRLRELEAQLREARRESEP
ncbi:hypothetical protein F0U61_39995 [Archangium violaceum]|uniref:hypothetical protein n=1 Tax=Archangium violaceum TaxID=83451 RepID=UPI002B285DBD|nr:hypothetical protein F0U61_39995 [Archangium violaceum]